EWFGGDGQHGAGSGLEFGDRKLPLPFPSGVETGEQMAGIVPDFALDKMHWRPGIELHADFAVGALGESELYEYDAIAGQFGVRAGKGFEPINFRREYRFWLRQGQAAFGLQRRGMQITDFKNGQPAFGEGGLGDAFAQAAKRKIIRADPERDRGAGVGPTPGAAAQ